MNSEGDSNKEAASSGRPIDNWVSAWQHRADQPAKQKTNPFAQQQYEGAPLPTSGAQTR